jgi:hypothetical protein
MIKSMWICHIFISIVCLLLCAFGSDSRKDSKSLSPPEWIMGSWQNEAESNSDNIDLYSFSEHAVTVQEGIFGKKYSPLSRYGQSGFSEEIKADSYRIVLNSHRGQAVYEFVLCKIEECGQLVDPVLLEPVLLVKVSIYGVTHRYSGRSINHWFTRQ